MKTVLFVCTGNICRSPMAEGLFRRAVADQNDFQAMSAGLGAANGQPPSAFAVQAVQELGIDISGIRSRMLTPELVQAADYIVGMTHSHVDSILLLYPQAAEKYAELAKLLGLPAATPQEGAESLARAIEELRDRLGMPA